MIHQMKLVIKLISSDEIGLVTNSVDENGFITNSADEIGFVTNSTDDRFIFYIILQRYTK